jgi:hypothetical protein
MSETTEWERKLSPEELQPNGEATPRSRLMELRHALLRIHKALLDMERRDYEKENGVVNAGQLFRLVIDHPQFSWLHNISEFVVRIDEQLDAKAPIEDSDVRTAVEIARKMFTPAEEGDAFQKKYYTAIQREPAVVMEHGALSRIVASESPESGKS